MKQIWKYSVKWFDRQSLIQPCKSERQVKGLINALLDNENVKDISISKIPEDNNVDETTCRREFIRTTRNYRRVYRCALCNLIKEPPKLSRAKVDDINKRMHKDLGQ